MFEIEFENIKTLLNIIIDFTVKDPLYSDIVTYIIKPEDRDSYDPLACLVADYFGSLHSKLLYFVVNSLDMFEIRFAYSKHVMVA